MFIYYVINLKLSQRQGKYTPKTEREQDCLMIITLLSFAEDDIFTMFVCVLRDKSHDWLKRAETCHTYVCCGICVSRDDWFSPSSQLFLFFSLSQRFLLCSNIHFHFPTFMCSCCSVHISKPCQDIGGQSWGVVDMSVWNTVS